MPNRKESRQRKKQAKKIFQKPVTSFKEIDLSTRLFIPQGMTRAYDNTRYTVMVYDNSPTTKGGATRAMIQKHDNSPIENHWSELQSIKNEIFGVDVTAVEYYPSEDNLIDDFNIYWIWIFEPGVLPIPVL